MARGGYRPGAGRPKRGSKSGKTLAQNDQVFIQDHSAPTDTADKIAANLTPLEYMLRIMRDPGADPARRDRMAAMAAPFIHRKAGEPGKKEEKQDRAEKASTGKFAPMPAPTVLPFRNKPR